MAIKSVLGIVLAGGAGTRLSPLTADRAKPAVPFGGLYRLIDFALSNLANGGIRKICVLTQYKSHSLDRHISTTWRMSSLLGNYVTPVPAQMRRGPRWFAGSADAIYQNLNLIYDERPDYVSVFGADHVYRMDPRQMVADHTKTSTELKGMVSGGKLKAELPTAVGSSHQSKLDKLNGLNGADFDKQYQANAERILLQSVAASTMSAHVAAAALGYQVCG